MRYECQTCGYIFDEGDLEIDEEQMYYCPNCGDTDLVRLEDSEYGN